MTVGGCGRAAQSVGWDFLSSLLLTCSNMAVVLGGTVTMSDSEVNKERNRKRRRGSSIAHQDDRKSHHMTPPCASCGVSNCRAVATAPAPLKLREGLPTESWHGYSAASHTEMLGPV